MTHYAATRTTFARTKVPQVTFWFWLIKVLCTTVGETAADFLNVNLGFGLSGTSVVTGLLLAVVLAVQFRADQYRPVRYWSAVTLVSVFGTLVTDNLTDALGVPLETSTVVFGVALAATFVAWFAREGTLSIHSIRTPRREAFYWAAIVLTFALGTATGDLMAQVLGLGYAVAGGIVVGLIVVLAVGWRLGLHPVLAFWAIYVLTRPLGASIGDYLSQPADQGGLDLGATATSAIFLVAIIGVVAYLAVTRADVIDDAEADRADEQARGGRWQTAAVVGILLVLGGAGYVVRTAALRDGADTGADTAAAAPAAPGVGGGGAQRATSPLGDLTAFRVITQDTLDKLNTGDQAGATDRVRDLESSWDDAQARLQARDRTAWTTIDAKIDHVLRELRAAGPDPGAEKQSLQELLASLG
jgi:uncharacterized membrane-anchored protein